MLDLCAAPGGKSTQLAGKLLGKGLLVCNEINAKRAKILSGNMERLGISNALVLNEHPKKLTERFAGYFDKILVDAPCSGEGMFRKEEAAVTDWTEDTNAICANRQLEILASAAGMLRPGGRLVYSTCNILTCGKRRCDLRVFVEESRFFCGKTRCTVLFPRQARLGAKPRAGTGAYVPALAAQTLGRGALCRRAPQDGRRAPAALSPEPAAKCPPELAAFRGQTGAALPEGEAAAVRGRVLSRPAGTAGGKGLRVLRAGLELGAVLKNRFEPAHAWALWLQTLENSVSFEEADPLLARYLSGDVLPSGRRGWTLVQADGLSLGWAKGDETNSKITIRRRFAARFKKQEDTLWQRQS